MHALWLHGNAKKALSRSARQRYLLAALVLAAVWLASCRERPAMLREIDARQRVARLAVQFHKASEASNHAVMADTDDASTAFADEARGAAAKAQAELDALEPLIRGLGYPREVGQLEAFSAGFARYRELDARILALAVENTNLKAQRLSFGPASTQADAIVAALDRVAAASSTDWRLRAVVSEGSAALRELQVLQAPHIAAAEDPEMTGLERRMDAAESRVRQQLSALRTMAPTSRATAVGEAASAFEAFMAAHREILALSRRNTNVRSLALVMNEKGALTRICDEALQRLQQALDTHTAGAR